MYCEFYGFSEKPFTITPNPNFIFLSRVHSEAFARLLYGVDSHAGFIALTGEVGTGKTTMLRSLLTRLDPEKYKSALVFNPCISAEQLLQNICREFDLPLVKDDRYSCLEALNSFLLAQSDAGRTVVLVIDEAQNLEPDVLEQVRLISNLETERDKLIQIILAGQPELDRVLGRHDLRQLNQRITVRCSLSPLTLADTEAYIAHRLKVSGSRIPGIFSKKAIRNIYRFSNGIPRLINVACEQALVMAWTRESLVVTPEMSALVLQELKPKEAHGGFWQRISNWLLAGRRY